MRVVEEIGDYLYVLLEDERVFCGKLTAVDPNGWILKTGSGNDDFEAVERSKIMAILPYLPISYVARQEDGIFYMPSPSHGGAVSAFPLEPSRNIPPGYVDDVDKWHHPIGGNCTCGCWGGWSSSSTSIKK